MSGERGRLIAGRYRVGRLLGQGGMGFVWHAHDQVLDREVAVKEVFVPDGSGDRSERAFREARAAGRLNHPGIVTIHDLVADEGRSWIVMELVRASSGRRPTCRRNGCAASRPARPPTCGRWARRCTRPSRDSRPAPPGHPPARRPAWARSLPCSRACSATIPLPA